MLQVTIFYLNETSRKRFGEDDAFGVAHGTSNPGYRIIRPGWTGTLNAGVPVKNGCGYTVW